MHGGHTTCDPAARSAEEWMPLQICASLASGLPSFVNGSGEKFTRPSHRSLSLPLPAACAVKQLKGEGWEGHLVLVSLGRKQALGDLLALCMCVYDSHRREKDHIVFFFFFFASVQRRRCSNEVRGTKHTQKKSRKLLNATTHNSSR